MKNGIYPALITPYTDDGRIDEKALCTLMDRLLDRGISGFYIGGSTAETMLLQLSERKRILETVVHHCGGCCDIVAHIGSQATRDTVDLARHAAELGGVCAISALPPIYYKYSEQELVNFFREVAQSTTLPFLVYHAPALSGVTFGKETFEQLFTVENIIGIKFTAYDLFTLQRLKTAFPEKIMINGHDELFLNTLPLNLHHAIGSTFNFMPEKFLAIQKAFSTGHYLEAYALQDEVNEIIEGLLRVGVFRGVKAMLRLLGLPMGDCRKPFAPMAQEELDFLRPLAEKCRSFAG